MGIKLSFDLAPEQALKFFRAKGYRTSFAWQDVWQAEHETAFTVAKMMDLDMLKDVRTAVDKALAEGQTFQEFRKNIEPALFDAGWWGRKEMADPLTGEIKEVQLGSVRRLRTIFRVNMQTSYAAGHWAQIEDNKADAPFLMYDAVDDGRTRPEHRSWDGKVLRADDPWWEAHTPPNGWNCRCSVIQLSASDLKRMGKSGPDEAPPVQTREYVNPRTGEVAAVPRGIDPGWAYNPGKARYAELRAQEFEKLETAPATMATAYIAAITDGDQFRRWLASPRGAWPLARLPDEDIAAIGAVTHVARMSASTARKQLNAHPELTSREYAQAQDVIDRGRKVQDTQKSLVYILEQQSSATGGYVLVVKATQTGKALWVTSYRRLSREDASRDAEIARLLEKGK